MVITSSTSCCLNLPPPTPASSSKTTQVAWQKKEGSLRRQCVMGVACMIIGLEMVNLTSGESRAIAKEPLVAVESNGKVVRWSDKRMCPPWHTNSFEIIVPENLPRPTAHRRWEAVGFSNMNASVHKFRITTDHNSCFSM